MISKHSLLNYSEYNRETGIHFMIDVIFDMLLLREAGKLLA